MHFTLPVCLFVCLQINQNLEIKSKFILLLFFLQGALIISYVVFQCPKPNKHSEFICNDEQKCINSKQNKKKKKKKTETTDKNFKY